MIARLLPQVRDIRRIGAAALDLCWVAAGRYDAYFERGVNHWDVAAGRLLCERAGLALRDAPAGAARGRRAARRAARDGGRAAGRAHLRLNRGAPGYGPAMTIAIVAGFCVLLLILAFLVPRLSHGPERGGSKVAGAPTKATDKAPGKLGHWLPSRSARSQKAIHKSGSTGRKGRDKMPF